MTGAAWRKRGRVRFEFNDLPDDLERLLLSHLGQNGALVAWAKIKSEQSVSP